MKLRNKKTGEIRDARIAGEHLQLWSTDLEEWFDYDDLDYLAEWWERYEEPKGSALDLMILTLTNFIENEPDEDKVDLEDCKQMLDRLKAWKRLKDNGFKFEGIKEDYTRILQQPFRTGKRYLQFNKSEDEEWMKDNWDDLNCLFGGEE